MKTSRILVFLLLCFAMNLQAQVLPRAEPLVPEEYDPAEFPGWAHDLRRFEVIFFGSLPLSFMMTSLVYDFALYASNSFSAQYAMGTQRTSEDINILLITSFSISAAVALADLIITKVKAASSDEP